MAGWKLIRVPACCCRAERADSVGRGLQRGRGGDDDVKNPAVAGLISESEGGLEVAHFNAGQTIEVDRFGQVELRTLVNIGLNAEFDIHGIKSQWRQSG